MEAGGSRPTNKRRCAVGEGGQASIGVREQMSSVVVAEDGGGSGKRRCLGQ